jgi:hypothetical protein
MWVPTQLIEHWGYWAIVVFVLLGNLGIPVPEESILVLAGYLVWQGDLRLLRRAVKKTSSACCPRAGIPVRTPGDVAMRSPGIRAGAA